MDHVVIPLGGDHAAALAVLADGVVAAAGFVVPWDDTHPHVTLVAHTDLTPPEARAAISAAVADIAPFLLHAHGYGFFTGDDPSELSLHVQVVRTRALDALHGTVCAALRRAGARVAGWSEPEQWSPHITLLDRGLDAARLGAGATWLARRRHPSWRIPVDRLLLTGGRPEHGRPGYEIRLATTSWPSPRSPA